MKKIRIAIIKYGGLSAGGTERWLQTMAANLPKNQFEVDYYYCDSSPYIGSGFQHPDTDPHRRKYLEDNNVNLIKFYVGAKDITVPTHIWVNTDFWQIFDESKYDIIQAGRAGHSEYPFTMINKPIVEFITLDAGVDNQKNIAWSIHLSEWQRRQWIKKGGNRNRSSVIPIPAFEPASKKDLRKKLKISKSSVVVGLHQRQNNEIFSSIPLTAFSRIDNTDVHFIIMGGGSKYKDQAKKLSLKNIHFINHSGNEEEISKFLNTLDIYAHGRKDGETFGAVLAEAMMHGVPCISHYSKTGANAHSETMGPGGVFVKNESQYISILSKLVRYPTQRKKISVLGQDYAKKRYSLESSVKKLRRIYTKLLSASQKNIDNKRCGIKCYIRYIYTIFKNPYNKVINFINTYQRYNESYLKHNYQYENTESIKRHLNIYKKYSRENLFNHPQIRLRDIINEKCEDITISVDIGAGGGWLSYELSKHFEKVISIEPSKSAKEIFINIYGKRKGYGKIKWITGFAETELKKIKIDEPVLYVTLTVLSHLRDKEVKLICRAINKNAVSHSVLLFNECYGKAVQHNMWHVRTKKWWTTQLTGWKLEFFGTEINDEKTQFKGFCGVKL